MLCTAGRSRRAVSHATESSLEASMGTKLLGGESGPFFLLSSFFSTCSWFLSFLSFLFLLPLPLPFPSLFTGGLNICALGAPAVDCEYITTHSNTGFQRPTTPESNVSNALRAVKTSFGNIRTNCHSVYQPMASDCGG